MEELKHETCIDEENIYYYLSHRGPISYIAELWLNLFIYNTWYQGPDSTKDLILPV